MAYNSGNYTPEHSQNEKTAVQTPTTNEIDECFSAESEAVVCELILGDRRHGLESLFPNIVPNPEQD